MREPLLRRQQSAAPDVNTGTEDSPAPDIGRVPPPNNPERKSVEDLRAEIQRRLAAQIDLGEPDPPEPKPQRPSTPRPDRMRMDSLRDEARRNATVKPASKSPFAGVPRHWRLKPSRVALVGVALVAGGLAAFLATQRDQASPPQPVAEQPKPEIVREAMTQILVAKTTIPIGQRLTPATLEWKDWPEAALRPEYVTSAATPDAMTSMIGSVVRSEVLVGDPVRKDKLAGPGQSYLSSILDAGMRAVSVAVIADSASGGFVSPNDHVDVVMTRPADGRQVSETILHNVRVLAIDDHLGNATPDGGTAQPAAPAETARTFAGQAVATLELSSGQAETIINATNTGKLSLVVVSLADYAETDSGETAANAAIRLSSPFWTTGPAAIAAAAPAPVVH